MKKDKSDCPHAISRREALKTTAAVGLTAAASVVGFRSHEERCLANATEAVVPDDPAQPAAPKADAVSGATRTSF
ncbi:MAG: twin-arginine translocation signal domain-containing protein, partial [Thermoguttaceae bacterium]|nr:twin-arginine translocation signal domain-containing protein [Thermoguttaceae bacterium]